MKIADCDYMQADYVAWYKYRVSFEEKAVRLLVLVILVGAFMSLYGSLSNDFVILGGSILFVAAGAAAWCWYCKVRLDRELRLIAPGETGRKATVKFTKHGILVDEQGDRTYYPFDEVCKARELPWYLFLFVDGKESPLVIDKKKIRTVSNDMEPYYIAKKLRELSPNYKYVRGNDLTYTGKYSKLVSGHERESGSGNGSAPDASAAAEGRTAC